MTKVAVCISGMSRSYGRAGPSIIKNIVEPFKADVFISTWKPTFPDPRFPDEADPEGMLEVFKPKKFDLEIFNEQRQATFATNSFHEHADWAGESVIRMLPMYYKIYMANFHKSEYERENQFKYDVVIRCRSDLNFESAFELPTPPSRVAYFPRINSQWDVNDQFWISNSETADVLASVYLNIPQLWFAGCRIHGETILKNFVANAGVQCELVDYLQYSILR